MNEQFSNASSTIKESLAQTKDEMKDTAREARDTIKNKTRRVVEQAKECGGEYAQHGKERAANRIGGFSASMRQTADRFEQDNDPNIAHYTRLLADKLENAATYVRENDFRRLRQDGENLARQYPEVFFGGMFVLGVVAARFLKASAERDGGGAEPFERQDVDAGETVGTIPQTTTTPAAEGI
jgi:hypothetical protein